MSNLITVSPEELRSNASVLDSKSESLASLISEITNIVYSLENSWQGDSNLGYVEQFMQVKGGLEAGRETVSLIAEELRRAATYFEDADQAAGSAFRQGL